MPTFTELLYLVNTCVPPPLVRGCGCLKIDRSSRPLNSQVGSVVLLGNLAVSVQESGHTFVERARFRIVSDPSLCGVVNLYHLPTWLRKAVLCTSIPVMITLPLIYLSSPQLYLTCKGLI